MKIYKIDGTFSTPDIVLDAEKGIFSISGNSYPEDPMGVYMPVIEWFKEYIQNPLPETVLEFKFIYFSTSSTQLIFELFRMMESIMDDDHKVTIRWYYSPDNEEIHENGEDFSSLFDIPFEVLENNA
ncbi:MAG: DUF1987 domain-containing protein [Bacteroidales bacterium]|nr:DUF1987 domain-containing protein [Bacteroidales bacterium]